MHGQRRESSKQYQRAAETARKQGLRYVADDFEQADARADALAGNCESSRRLGRPALALAMCGETSDAEKLAAETSKLSPNAMIWNAVQLPEIQAMIALHRDEPAKGIELLASASPYERAYPDSVYVRGLIYLYMKRGAEAVAEFRKIADHEGASWGATWVHPYWGQYYALSYLGMARGYVLAGEEPQAKDAYEKFLALWKTADPDLPVLRQARAEYAKLRLRRAATANGKWASQSLRGTESNLAEFASQSMTDDLEASTRESPSRQLGFKEAIPIDFQQSVGYSTKSKTRHWIRAATLRHSLQLLHLETRVLYLGFFQQRQIPISVFPELQKILVGRLRLGLFPRERKGSRVLQACQSAHGIIYDDAGVTDNFMELRGGFRTPTCGHLGLSAHVYRIQRTKKSIIGALWRSQLVRNSNLQQIDCRCRIMVVQRKEGSQRWQIAELHRRILGILLLQAVG